MYKHFKNHYNEKMPQKLVKGSLNMKQGKKILKQNYTTSEVKNKQFEQWCFKKWGIIKLNLSSGNSSQCKNKPLHKATV